MVVLYRVLRPYEFYSKGWRSSPSGTKGSEEFERWGLQLPLTDSLRSAINNGLCITVSIELIASFLQCLA